MGKIRIPKSGGMSTQTVQRKRKAKKNNDDDEEEGGLKRAETLMKNLGPALREAKLDIDNIDEWNAEDTATFMIVFESYDQTDEFNDADRWKAYANIMITHHITGEMLLIMTPTDLVNLSGEGKNEIRFKFGHAIKVCGKIKKLHQAAMERQMIPEEPATLSALADVDIEDFSLPECCMYIVFLVCFTMMTIMYRGPGDANFWISDNMARPVTMRGYTQSSNGKTGLYIPEFPGMTTGMESTNPEWFNHPIGSATVAAAHGNKWDSKWSPHYRLASNFANNNMGSTQSAFDDIAEVGDIYMHFRQVLLPILFSNDEFWVGQQNKLMGGIRLRTVRVKDELCGTNDMSGIPKAGPFSKGKKTCYHNVWGGYSGSTSHETKEQLTIDIPSLKTSEQPEGVKYIKWTSAEANKEPEIWMGEMADYPGSGYIVDIPRNKTQAYMIIKDLEDGGVFLNRATRVMFVDWVTYNPNVELHCVARLSYELTQAGFVNPIRQIKTWNFVAQDKMLETLWMIFLVFVVYYTLQEVWEIGTEESYTRYKESYEKDREIYHREHTNRAAAERGAKEKNPHKYHHEPYPTQNIEDTLAELDTKFGKDRIKYYQELNPKIATEDFWHVTNRFYYHYMGPSTFDNAFNILDTINVVIFYVYIFQRVGFVQYKDDFEMFDEYNYHSFRLLDYYTVRLSYTQMINGFLLYIKIFKYVTLSKRVLMLVGMILTASGPICYFIFCAGIVTVAFAFMGYVLFSVDVYDFRDFKTSFINGLKYWVTEMDIDTLRTSNRQAGLIFFIMWTIIFLLILANVFVAILADAYVSEQEAVKEEEKQGLGKKSVSEILAKGLNDWVDKISGVTSIAERAASIATLGASDKALNLAKQGAQSMGDAASRASIRVNVGSLLTLGDSNSDGGLNATEFAKATNISEEEAQKEIERNDTDGDKKLDVNELASTRFASSRSKKDQVVSL